MTKRLPNERIWFPFHGGDWLKRTSHLPSAARGLYLDLVAWLWDEDRSVPDAEVTLMQVTRCTALREFRASWPLIRPMLQEVSGGLRDPWVDDCREKFDAYVNSQSRKGKLSAAKRSANRGPTGFEPDANQNPTGRPTGESTGPPTGRQPPDPDPQQVHKEQGFTPREAPMGDWMHEPPNVRVLTRVAHDLIEDQIAGIVPVNASEAELHELLKERAAKLRLTYDSVAIKKGLDSARWQRAKKMRGVGPTPSDAPVNAACWMVAELLRYHGGTMTRASLNQVIFEAAEVQWGPEEKDFREAVIRLAWLDDTLRIFPQWFEIAGDTVSLTIIRGDRRGL